jgi:hypothetical protein
VLNKKEKLPVENWEMPDVMIYRYALSIKNKHPEIWALGGNIFGHHAFELLENTINRGYWLKEEEWFYKKWQAFVARHKHDFRIAGVIANLKWLAFPEKGEHYVKELIEDEIKKRASKKLKKRGS